MPDRRCRLVGGSLPRLDGWEKATGRFKYLTDMTIPDALWASVIRSPHPRADVLSIDAAGAAAVFRAADVPRAPFNPAAAPPSDQLDLARDKYLLTDAARHVGDGVAVVVAGTRYEAQEAARAARVRWLPKEAVLDIDSALERGRVLGTLSAGDSTTAAFAASDLVVSERFWNPAAQHICLEPHACAAVPEDGGITLWSNTQSPAQIRRLCAEILGLPQERIRLRKVAEGGGFGGRQELYEEALICWLALHLGRPVRLTYSRDEELTAGRGRHGARLDVRIGLSDSGRLLASEIDVVLDSGAYASHAPYVLGAMATAVPALYPYATHRFIGTAVQTNTLPGGAYRGYGGAQVNFGFEQVMDIAGRRLGLTPVAIRRINVHRPGHDGAPAAAGGRSRTVLDHGERFMSAATAGSDGRLRGNGVAIATKSSVTSPEEDTSEARVRWNGDGSVTLYTGTCDSGTGSSTVLAQIVAEEIGLPFAWVQVVEGDTAAGPTDVGSTAQRSVFVGGEAARLAAAAARRGLLQHLLGRLDVESAELDLVAGRIMCARTGEEIPVDRADLANVALADGIAVHAPNSGTPSFAACFVRVAVDQNTGVVEVEDCLAVVDCGQPINPQGAAGQVHGGTVQGLGLARMDAWQPGEDGRGPGTIQAHGVPGALDVPLVKVVFSVVPVDGGPFGGNGVGEVPITPVAAAVANALADATGERFTRLPLRPQEVWQVLRRKNAGQEVSCS
ncbi:molybdopterin cofactor-binding domain-containing protein [Nonomuraea sp. B1E8]|uniref:xanthine dehydrogenase family protein molybdopterin-binding subunit n=1 Tax=unclassified Nonomuraea TaxID=2593643 RepID=UPI00325CE56C